MKDTQVGVKITETKGRQEKKKGKYKALCRWTINFTPWEVNYYRDSISELNAYVMYYIAGSVLKSIEKMKEKRLKRLERDYHITVEGNDE